MTSLMQRDIILSNTLKDLKELFFLRFRSTLSNVFFYSMTLMQKLYIGPTSPYFFDFNSEMQVYKVFKIYFKHIIICSFLSAIELLSL